MSSCTSKKGNNKKFSLNFLLLSSSIPYFDGLYQVLFHYATISAFSHIFII